MYTWYVDHQMLLSGDEMSIVMELQEMQVLLYGIALLTDELSQAVVSSLTHF